MIPYSFLDLAIVSQGNDITTTFENSVKSAQIADQTGYTRYWFAEHHNMISVASSATSVLIGHIAGKTSKIRVGSGGIMLPNHSPLVIAEHFGTLASLYPNRIDLGLGRAPGTDQITAAALNPNFQTNVRHFPENVKQLQRYFSSKNGNAQVRAIPGEGTDVPIWILGSSTDSAYLASELGLPYAFASHFAPAQMIPAFDIYTHNYQSQTNPSKKMACVNVIIAKTEQEAERIATSYYQMFLGMIRNQRNFLQAPIDSMEGIWEPGEEAYVRQMTACSFIGTKDIVKNKIERFIKDLNLNEIMTSAPIFHLEDKLYSMNAFAEIMNELKS